jgi:hypothetical protein
MSCVCVGQALASSFFGYRERDDAITNVAHKMAEFVRTNTKVFHSPALLVVRILLTPMLCLCLWCSRGVW